MLFGEHFLDFSSSSFNIFSEEDFFHAVSLHSMQHFFFFFMSYYEKWCVVGICDVSEYFFTVPIYCTSNGTLDL